MILRRMVLLFGFIVIILLAISVTYPYWSHWRDFSALEDWSKEGYCWDTREESKEDGYHMKSIGGALHDVTTAVECAKRCKEVDGSGGWTCAFWDLKEKKNETKDRECLLYQAIDNPFAVPVQEKDPTSWKCISAGCVRFCEAIPPPR